MQPLKQIRLDSSLRRGPAIVRLGVSGAFSIGQGHGGVGRPILLKGSRQAKSYEKAHTQGLGCGTVDRGLT